MIWNLAIGSLANTTRRSVLLTGLLSGISMTPRLSTAAGEDARLPAQPMQRNDPMTTVTTNRLIGLKAMAKPTPRLLRKSMQNLRG